MSKTAASGVNMETDKMPWPRLCPKTATSTAKVKVIQKEGYFVQHKAHIIDRPGAAT
jgi:hypothetical protein